ncbi:MAG: helix-turn-helix domain-containing protein [Bacteroidales bacterium]
MEYNFSTKLKGTVALSSNLHESRTLQTDSSLYKFIWVQEGSVTIEVEHVEIEVEKNQIIALTPLHHFDIKEVKGTYLTLLFNSNFYCIFGHDNEVSCNGFLFHGSAEIKKIQLGEREVVSLEEIVRGLEGEYGVNDTLQEEMLRILLKRFIIMCTRFARKQAGITTENEHGFNLVREYYVLVDNHYKEKKQVKEYAALLNRSPKTLSNLFTAFGLPSPLNILHQRIETEAKRLLLYSSKSAKEIAYILGFEDLSSFSRFFSKRTGESITEYRKREKRE